MLLYKNNTRFKALVTVLVQSTENPAEALAIGAKVAPKKLPAEPGAVDWEVAPGESIVLLNNTTATVLGVRNAP
ncbi:MAG: hypothetical protein IPK80_34640 [Nannocystis sp.]|nr:hypothetical protein [Nannocystis sp.]